MIVGLIGRVFRLLARFQRHDHGLGTVGDELVRLERRRRYPAPARR